MQRKGTSTPEQANAAEAEQKNTSDAALPSQEELNLGVPPPPPREQILVEIDSQRKKLDSEMRMNHLSIVAYTSLLRTLNNIDRKLGNITNKDIQELRAFDEKIEAAKQQKKTNEQLHSDNPAQPPQAASTVQYSEMPPVRQPEAKQAVSNPILAHLQKWEADNKAPPGPERALVLNGASDPRISPELKQLIATEAQKLWIICSADYDDTNIMREKLQEYFLQMFREVATAIGGKDSAFSHEQKIDAYNSFVFAVKTQAVTTLLPLDPNVIKIFSDLVNKYRIPPNTPLRTHSLEHDIPVVSLTDVVRSKDGMQLNKLIQSLKQMRQDYNALERSNHNKSFDALITKIENIKGDNPTKKLEEAMALIYREFSGEQSKRSSVFNFGSKTNPLKFIDNINNDKHGHHYPRMLAMVLEQAYRDNDRLRKNAPSIGGERLSSKVHIGREDIYSKSIPKITPSEDNVKFIELKKELKKCNLTEPQAYRLFIGIDKIDVKMAKKLWPALKYPLNLSDKLIEKLGTDPDAVKKEVDGHLRKAAEIKNQFAQINVGNKTPNQEIDKQCAEAIKLLDDIAKSMAKVNENIKPAPVVARQNKA